MKPWLFDILACPIDKNFPLQLYIFSFETKSIDFSTFIEIYQKRNIDLLKKEELIEVYQENEKIFMKDNVIIEGAELKDYVNLVILSIKELDNIFDRTANILSKECFKILKSIIKLKILEFSEKMNPNQLDDILPELYFLNKIKVETEIDSGLLFCNKCNRWYPIIETIPQMLPDEYRNKEKEIEFLKINKNLLDEEFLNQDLKPFNL
ncbi:MAG: hypothetical protein KAX18_14340 [Candidatus Lokiarchaeota archaeon]|nr:hypothetical protein [Candidatus Lokiarchaeota archaeon]MCK4382214.1 hypothetical protein [Candidatus Lokiarchaeota archaeon]